MLQLQVQLTNTTNVIESRFQYFLRNIIGLAKLERGERGEYHVSYDTLSQGKYMSSSRHRSSTPRAFSGRFG